VGEWDLLFLFLIVEYSHRQFFGIVEAESANWFSIVVVEKDRAIVMTQRFLLNLCR